MKKHLYDVFADRWYRGGTIWIYSDPHFSDEDTLKFHNAHFNTIQERDEHQIKKINSVVGKNDTIIFLGDIGNLECVKRIKGYKVLIMGNHDAGATNYIRVKDTIETFSTEDMTPEDLKKFKENGWGMLSDPQHVKMYVAANEVLTKKYTKTRVEDNHLFDEVYEGILVVSDRLVLSHEPVSLPGLFNIHGHVHAKVPDDDTHMNVVAEHINYEPVSLNKFFTSGKLKKIENIHRIYIDGRKDKGEKY
jgi:calcineurin-like phosphoesterase family protein